MTDHLQSQDGVAHLAYYSKEHNVSFVWNGTKGAIVDVCPGGYGEPVRAHFDLAIDIANEKLFIGLLHFGRACETYLASACNYCDRPRADHHPFQPNTVA